MNLFGRKTILKTILIHTCIWVIFLAIPTYLFSVLILLKIEEARKMETFRVAYTYCMLIGLFYYNYYVLIPKFLFNNRYLLYSFFLFIIYILANAIPILIFYEIFQVDVFSTDLITELEEFDWLLLVMLYLVSFVVSIALRLNARWQYAENEKISVQLSYLKSQINPHFLFNTLNGIYSVAIDKAPQAADMIEKLSTMMRYTLHDTQKDYVPLEKEINYLENYIELQRGRFDESVKIKFLVEGDFENNRIAPLLLIPFIENAFKHGVNSEEKSDISINISHQNDELILQVKNKKVAIKLTKEEASGLGIENTRNRLQLIYPTTHELKITETKKHFNVSLQIFLT